MNELKRESLGTVHTHTHTHTHTHKYIYSKSICTITRKKIYYK